MLFARQLGNALFPVRNVLIRRSSSQRWFTASSSIQASEAEFEVARQWLKNFNESVIPKTVGDVSYSRSSGPGGQNVNKVNSKAQLKVGVNRLLVVIPPALHPGIRASRFYAQKTDTLLIQADESRKQAANKDTCWRKLHAEIYSIGMQLVPGETSAEQKEKVKKLKRFENEARLQSKKQLSSKKASRASGFGDG